MRSLALVFRREFFAYWTSPVAYVVIAVFLVLSGIFFFGQLSEFVTLSSRSGGAGVDVNQQLIRPYFYSVSVMVLFLLPLVTMRLFSEEKRQGTLEIVLTTPIPEFTFVLGKYLASLAMFVVILGGAAIHVGILLPFGSPEAGPIVTGFLGLILTGAAYLALGLFFSALTQNQVVSAAVAFTVFLILWLFNWLGQIAKGTLASALTYASFVGHFETFGQGILDTADLVYFLSLIALGLYGATQAVLSTRWKA